MPSLEFLYGSQFTRKKEGILRISLVPVETIHGNNYKNNNQGGLNTYYFAYRSKIAHRITNEEVQINLRHPLQPNSLRLDFGQGINSYEFILEN